MPTAKNLALVPPTEQHVSVKITPPAFKLAAFHIVGTAPLGICRFSQKDDIKRVQESETSRKKGGKRPPKNYKAMFEAARHLSREGWDGIPASAFRNAMIRACALIDFKMTLAKSAIFIEPDGLDREEGTPLVKILSDQPPKQSEMPGRNRNGGIDIRVRPLWERWGANVRVSYDSDIFSAEDITNLLMRAGRQVGVGEGRPFSKESAGIGWGTFAIGDHPAKPARKRREA